MIIILTLILTFFQLAPVQAIDEFIVNQSITFRVNPDKSANVTQAVTLTNNLSQIYPQDYSLSLTGPAIALTSPNNNPDFQITKYNQTADKSDISLHLLRPGIGKDQSTNFSLNYQIKDFVTTKGKTNEISLPIYQNSQLPAKVSATIILPTAFGELSSASVPVVSTHNLGDTTEINLNLTQVNSKILLVFGDHQLVNFNLKYFLKNDSQVTTTTDIAIPPDTNNQTILLKNIEPKPQNIFTDTDGNWLARFSLPPHQQLEVSVVGQAKIFSARQISVAIDSAKYLTSQTFWPVTDPQITTVSQELNSVEQIYKYVVKKLTYDYSQINNSSRKGAIFALNYPQNSLCTEFSDLFVTLTRSIGVPAREVEGYALSNNQKVKPVNPNSDVLHAWAQYYDSQNQTWKSVDPTWENTTNGVDYFSDLDLNHLAFVIHGVSSDYPSPPGAYKSGNDVKTVDVNYATEEYVPTASAPILKLTSSSIEVYNPNNHSLNNLRLKSQKLSWQDSITTIPPFATISLKFPQTNFLQNALPRNQQIEVQLTSDESPQASTIRLQNNQHFFSQTILIVVTILALSLGGIILTTQKKS